MAALLTVSVFQASAEAQQTVEYSYDDLGRLVQVAYPSGALVVYAYDENGNRMRQVITGPTAPVDPSPADGALDVPLDAVLSWSAVEAAGAYDLYLWGEDGSRPNSATGEDLSQTTYQPAEPFEPATVFHWQVIARTEVSVIDGPVWTFSTIDQPPSDPEESGDGEDVGSDGSKAEPPDEADLSESAAPQLMGLCGCGGFPALVISLGVLAFVHLRRRRRN